MERKSILEGMFHHVNGEDEPPVSLSLPTGTGPFVFVCEHASNRIPAKFNSLGVSDAVRMSHAAWDIGALALSQSLSNHFQSPLVASTVSRLVYDCNRAPESPTAIVKSSEHDAVPGNLDLTADAARQRANAYYQPFAKELSGLLDRRSTQGLDSTLVTIHSFTPIFHGQPRAVEIGILHDSDSRLADDMLAAGKEHTNYNIERNQPYGPDDDVTHTLKVHALPRQLPNVMLEVRNDLLQDARSVKTISELLIELLNTALKPKHSNTSREPA